MPMVQKCLDGRPRPSKMGAEGEAIPTASANHESFGKSRLSKPGAEVELAPVARPNHESIGGISVNTTRKLLEWVAYRIQFTQSKFGVE
jgi:hypothetical protein